MNRKKTKNKKSWNCNFLDDKYFKKDHHPSYLLVALVTLLLIEGILFTNTVSADWREAGSVFDMTGQVREVSADVAMAVQPATDFVIGVNRFYQLSATAMMKPLDISPQSPFEELNLVVDGVIVFYEQTSAQMASLLDMSGSAAWPGKVAGVSAEVCD